MVINKKRRGQIFALLVIVLFMNLPLVSALQISSVRAEDVTQTSATIKWNTDEQADSFVSYGTDANALQTIGDANQVLNHSLAVTSLTPETDYKFKVESAGIIDDNGGSLYSFSTPAPDTTAPELEVELPERIAGAELRVEGTTEAGALVTIYVDGSLAGSTSAIPVTEGEATSIEGTFTFASIILTSNQDNVIKIEARDGAGNVAGVEGNIFADSTRPTVEMGTIPDIAAENSIEVNGTISEPGTYEIFVNEKSAAKGEGQTIQETIRLEEGENVIKIVVKDLAGWEVTKEFDVSSDTQPPQVTFKLEEGNEYYQGRADTNINGETEPGADVFLYVYRPLGYEYTPKFDKAWATTTADENGEFTFEVDFEDEPALELLKGLKPTQVPQGLQEYSIFSTAQVAEQQQFTYYVFVIAEDKSGKSGFLQQTVNVNTCFSGNFDFDVQSVAYLQAPLKLDPRLLDDGKQTITATFNLSYRGSGSAQINYGTNQIIKPAYEITRVDLEPACTQGMQDDLSFKVACRILPHTPQINYPSTSKLAWFVQYNLASAEELSEKKEDFWNEFKKRRLVFPLKVKISYRERDGQGNYAQKTQASCIDLGYFVDIPIDSQDMIPDFLAEEGLDAITVTIEKIDLVMPYLEQAILISGMGSITTWLTLLTARWLRLTMSKLEPVLTKVKETEGKKSCPVPAKQNELYLQSTLESWEGKTGKELWEKQPPIELRAVQPPGEWDAKNDDGSYKNALDTLCPQTASLWKAEAVIDQAFRWTWDRFMCRKVPAGWTSSATEEEVNQVIQKQNKCSVSSNGIPLEEVENCQELITKQVTYNPSPAVAQKVKEGAFKCYRYNNRLYVISTEQQGDITAGKVVHLSLVHDFGLTLRQGEEYVGQTFDLLGYRPPNSDRYIIGADRTCDQMCKNPRKPGYTAAPNGIEGIYYRNEKGELKQTEAKNGCFREKKDALGNIELEPKRGGTQIRAGYTADCFVELDPISKQEIGENPQTGTTGLMQCVCEVAPKEKTPAITGKRTAAMQVGKDAEKWSYHEERKYVETGKRVGTYYPEWRYYTGRDVSAAFGQDYLLDALNKKKEDESISQVKNVHEVNPYSQHIGAFQSLCLTQIRARLVVLRNVLEGLRGCIQQAKYTGLQDAGMCKTVFSQHVCGLIYKAIAYFFTQCSPYDITDEIRTGAFETVGAAVEAGLSSIPQAMEYSIDDVKRSYGNAKLNQFFAGGAQGFAQSICMAAFGYDWPMGTDFIMDAAYAVPMKTSFVVIPAERELATFNPTKGTAVFNYEVGAVIIPGCQVKSYDVYLKCIGPEDGDHPGIQCGTQGCDCLRTTTPTTPGDERTKILDRGFDLKSGAPFSPPIEAPQVVNSNYRYDHVVIELKLDPFEDPDKCFDDGYKDGKFYAPITDISPPAQFLCQAQPLTGRYQCPELLSAFGGGSGAYLEDPYISCFDKNTNTWASCDTPNLFTKGDFIKVRAHVQTDGQLYCLQWKKSGLGIDPLLELPWPLPQNLPGSFTPEINLGKVGPEMFSGAVNTLIRSADSDPSCSTNIQFDSLPTGQITPKSYRFNFAKDPSGKYKVTVDTASGISVDPGSIFRIDGGTIKDSGNQEFLTGDQLTSIAFILDGFKVRGLIGSPVGTTPGKTSCVYQSQAASGAGLTQNQKQISVTAQLYLPDAGGSCYNPSGLVKPPVFGQAQHTQQIQVQLEPLQTLIATRMHQEFMNNNCAYVQQNTQITINNKRNDFPDAQALYYSIACYIKDGGTEWMNRFRTEITSLLRIFFLREYIYEAVKGTTYPDSVRNTAEYKKIETYLCCAAEKLGQKSLLCPNNPSCGAGPAAIPSIAAPPK